MAPALKYQNTKHEYDWLIPFSTCRMKQL